MMFRFCLMMAVALMLLTGCSSKDTGSAQGETAFPEAKASGKALGDKFCEMKKDPNSPEAKEAGRDYMRLMGEAAKSFEKGTPSEEAFQQAFKEATNACGGSGL